jgi:ketosteroid isomerase-like protein
MPDGRVLPAEADPAELAVARDTIRLAFVAALQHLPPRQRAVLILREVLRWKATEVAELLETTVASVNSALQRARAALAAADVTATSPQEMDEEQKTLLARYVDAFERYDLDSLTSLLHEDATWSMPPYDLWLQTHEDIRKWCLGPGIGCRGSQLIPTVANGSPAFGQYKPSPTGGYEPWSLQVLEISDGRIAGITFFLDTSALFPLFDLPPRLVCVEHANLEPEPPRDELQPGQGFHRDDVRVDDSPDLADGKIGVAALQQALNALAQPRHVGTKDRTAEDQNDRARPRGPTQRIHARRRRLLGSGQPPTSFLPCIE